jgi:O6-methylguanine-DNA--protein-cysteine methyltransferase
VAQCWLGALLVAATGQGICAVTLGSEPEALVQQLQDRFPQADLAPGDASFEHTLAQVLAALDDPRQGAALPLDVRGTAFQQRVWQALRAVPPGVTLTYAELAARIGQPQAVRPWPMPVRATRSPCSFPAIASCGSMVLLRAIAGASRARPPCLHAKACPQETDA